MAMKMKLGLILAGIMSLASAGAFTQDKQPDPKFHIYLCFGQSNMEAGARPEEQDKGEVDKRFQMLAAADMPKLNRTKGNWYLATPPLNRQENNMGPVDWFGRTMAANMPKDYRVGVINVSVAGAKIELWQKDIYTNYLDRAEPWMKNICKQYNGNPYQRLVDMAKIAQQAGVIRGILLHQGESNPNDQQWCNKVKGIYDNLMKDLNLKPEDVPFLAGELKSAEEGGKCAGFNTAVLANLPKVLPNSYIISSKGCKGVNDGFHFNTAGMRELGKRYAIQMLKCHGFEYREAAAALPAAGATAPAAGAAAETASRTVEDGGTGPYKALMAADRTLATHTIFRPKDLSGFGKTARLPIVAWGNGACANSPWEHVNFLSEVASHGFLVIAIGPMPAEGQRGGAGGPTKASLLMDAINWAIAQNGNPTSQYYEKLDATKIAVSGMSCGGLQALEAAPDPRVTTAMICNSGILGDPARGMGGMPSLTKEHLAKLHTPTIYILGGEKDIAYNNGMDDFRRINHVPVFAANLNVGHGGTYGKPHGGDFAKVATAWFQWQLKGDKAAAKMFEGESCGVARMEGWKVEKKKIP
jgi:predicted alpha/beta-hydrolase family hydrolase